MWNQTLFLLQTVMPLVLSHQQGEELDQNTYAVQNRRQNVYASLEVCIFLLGCLRAVLNEDKFASNFPICPKS